MSLRGAASVSLARQYQPRAVMLDLSLPDIDGWAVLDQLKQQPDTRHIPVHILSGKDARERALRQGAFSYLVKPVGRERLQQEFLRMQTFLGRSHRNLLIVEDNEAQRNSLVELLGAEDVSISQAASGTEAIAALRAGPFDCVVLDLSLPDISGFELLETHWRGSGAAHHARGGLHRQGPHAPGSHAAAARGADGDREGRALARAPARRDLDLPASARGAPARGAARNAGRRRGHRHGAARPASADRG